MSHLFGGRRFGGGRRRSFGSLSLASRKVRKFVVSLPRYFNGELFPRFYLLLFKMPLLGPVYFWAELVVGVAEEDFCAVFFNWLGFYAGGDVGAD